MTQEANPPELDLARARTFIARATWVDAITYRAFAPHEYVTRWSCRAQRIEREFVWFVGAIEAHGYWRAWGRRKWRSINIDAYFFWLYWEPVPVAERTIINRWHLAATEPEPAQLEFAMNLFDNEEET